MTDIAETPQRFGRHDNAFGFLRLLFASLVIVSHTPELVDGNRHRELLTRLVGAMSFGEFAVAGFFVISGFLITASYVTSRSLWDYLLKRVARIYPAFIVASLFALLIVAPLSGAEFDGGVQAWAISAARIAALARPMVAGAFPGQPQNNITTALDGAMWTIQYEFACYLLAIGIAVLGLHRRPGLLFALALALTVGARLLPDGALAWLPHASLFPAPPHELLRLVGMFVAGAAFYGVQARLRFGRGWIAAAAIGLAVTLPIPLCADAGLAVFGGYLIFATALLAGPTWVGRRINNRTDISYGVYLYAWPVEQLLVRYSPTRNLIVIGVGTWLVAAALGLLSWTLVEKPAMRWARGLLRRVPAGRRALATY